MFAGKCLADLVAHGQTPKFLSANTLISFVQVPLLVSIASLEVAFYTANRTIS